MDDIVIFDSSKERLHALLVDIEKYLNTNLCLSLKKNYQIFPTFVRGVDFVGYRHFGEYKLLRKTTCKKFKKKMLRIKAKDEISYQDFCSFNSYLGWIKFCDGYRLSEKYCSPIEYKMVEYCHEVIRRDKVA